MRRHVVNAMLLLSVVSCRPEAQAREPLPACEWCGAAEAPAGIGATLQLADDAEPGERLIVTGTILEADGRTPASGVLVYAYHTDATGVYPMRGNETGNGRRHGALRGWLRTGDDGRYRIETIRPAPYPTRNEAAHIHLTVTPPGGVEGWIESVVFSDDPLLTAVESNGPGVVELRRDDAGVLHAQRNIRLSEARAASAQPRYEVDLQQSRVDWVGTKFRGRGRHEGFVRLREATLEQCSLVDCQGRFVLDMHNLEITDIPASDPVPRRRLRDHLRSRDFFWTERFPHATFVLTRIVVSDNLRTATARADSIQVDGELTLRDVTRSLQFPAYISHPRAGVVNVRAELTIDRQQWGVRYRFDPIRNELVDDEIMLVISIVAHTHAERAT